MQRHLNIWVFFLLLACYEANGQDVFNINKWREYIEELAEEGEENNEFIESLYDDLSYLSEHPFNLNEVTPEQLRQLPFLSDEQIEDIMSYRKKHIAFNTIYELKNIIDFQTIELILPFVVITPVEIRTPFNIKNALKYGINELMLGYNRTLNKKIGYSDVPDSIMQKYPNRKYLGEAFYHSLRYSYTFDNRIQAGLVGEKDAGEPFWKDSHHGYDYYSAHVFLKDFGKIKTLTLGDYKASFGQGLVISNDFTPSRSSILSQAERRNNGFRRHYSTNENIFFRGVASTIALQNIDISVFYSFRKMDGTADGETVSSFKTDGLHRTQGERGRKHAFNMQTIGGNVRFALNRISVGLTALNYSFGGLSVNQELRPYSRFYFRGKDNTNASIDYVYRHRRFIFYGEAAISANGAAATLNALQINASSSLKGLILYRNYSKRYQAFFSNAFSQGSTIQNEEGLYLSLQWVPFAYWRLSGYADFFRYPWIKYAIDAPSSGREYMLQADYLKVKNTTLSLRYRFKNKERNITGGTENKIGEADQHRLRLQATVESSKTMTYRTILEGNFFNDKITATSKGWMISQSVGFSDPDFPLSGSLFAAYFNTDDYNTRIVGREKNMLYTFSMPMFYGKGMRLAMILRYNFTRRLYLSVKSTLTHYTDREEIGSALETIEGKNKADLYAQLRWKF